MLFDFFWKSCIHKESMNMIEFTTISYDFFTYLLFYSSKLLKTAIGPILLSIFVNFLDFYAYRRKFHRLKSRTSQNILIICIVFSCFIDDQKLTGSLWVCSCLARSDELENFLVQLNSWAYLQLNGLSPVWDLMWIFRFSDLANARLQFSCCNVKELSSRQEWWRQTTSSSLCNVVKESRILGVF